MVRATHCAYVVFALHNQATVKSHPSIAPISILYTPPQHRLIWAARNIQAMTSNPCCHSVRTPNSVRLSTSSQQQIQDPMLDKAIIQKTSAGQPDSQQMAFSDEAAPTTTDVTANAIPKNTFYRRSLPDTCVAFSSKLGREYFESAMRHRGLKSYFHLMEQYTTQSEPAFCGISTLVIALNALAVDPRQIWKGSWRWYEESMLNCCIDLEQAKETGITMAVRQQ